MQYTVKCREFQNVTSGILKKTVLVSKSTPFRENISPLVIKGLELLDEFDSPLYKCEYHFIGHEHQRANSERKGKASLMQEEE